MAGASDLVLRNNGYRLFFKTNWLKAPLKPGYQFGVLGDRKHDGDRIVEHLVNLPSTVRKTQLVDAY